MDPETWQLLQEMREHATVVPDVPSSRALAEATALVTARRLGIANVRLSGDPIMDVDIIRALTDIAAALLDKLPKAEADTFLQALGAEAVNEGR